MPATLMQALPAMQAKITGNLQKGLGLYQILRGDRLRRKAMRDYADNPYVVPTAATQAVNLAGKQAQGTKMAGQDVMEENLRSGTAQSISQARKSATSPSQILASTIQSYNAQQKAQENIDLQAAQNWQDRQAIYRNAVMALSPYQEKAWQYNVLAPIQARLNQASMASQSGWNNLSQGIQSGINSGANFAYQQSLGGGISALNPQTTQPPTTEYVQPSTTPYSAPYWGGGYPNTSIQQRQGNYNIGG